MAFYLVQAKPVKSKLKALKEKLDRSEIQKLRPFGNTLQHSLMNARLNPDGTVIWEEEDYCSPPLAQERAAVLDEHFTELSVKPVTEEEGWEQIKGLPFLWNELGY